MSSLDNTEYVRTSDIASFREGGNKHTPHGALVSNFCILNADSGLSECFIVVDIDKGGNFEG